MTSIKITPFVLFLILLIVLVISAVLGSYYNEGFISYEFPKQPIDLVAIPQYSTNNKKDNITTYKLFDNLFFDNKNGNIIEVDGTSIEPSEAIKFDNTGRTVTSIYVTTRSKPEKTVSYKTVLSGSTVIPKDTDESMIASMSESYKTFRYDSQSLNTSSYSVFYVGWSTSTFINIISNKTKDTPAQILASFMFNPTVNINSPIDYHTFDTNNNLDITRFVKDSDANNNTMVLNNTYDSTHPLFQMSKYVYYDSKNGNLILDNTKLTVEGLTIEGATTQTAAKTNVKNGPAKIVNNTSSVLNSKETKPVTTRIDPVTGLAIADTVDGSTTSEYKPLLIYDRTSTEVSDGIDNNDPLFSSLQNVAFTSWFAIDQNGQNFVIYNANSKNTVIIILAYSDCCEKKMFNVVNVKRFLNGALDESGSNTPVPSPTSCSTSNSNSKSSSGSGSGSSSCKTPTPSPPIPPVDISPAMSSDYILKTQIIPPVCPTCYSEEINRGSANKGSGSVSGSISGSGSVPASRPGSGSVLKTTTGSRQGEDSTIEKPLGNLAGNLFKTANNLSDVGGRGAANLLSSFWGNNVGGGIIVNTTETPNDPNFSPTINNRQQQGDYSGVNSGLPFVAGADPYSYYGALPAKGNSNYMPVTADFSSFGN